MIPCRSHRDLAFMSNDATPAPTTFSPTSPAPSFGPTSTFAPYTNHSGTLPTGDPVVDEWVLPIVLAAVGLVFAFAGQRLLRVMFSLAGTIMGGVSTFVLLHTVLKAEFAPSLLVSIAGLALGGILTYVFDALGAFCVGGGTGGVVAVVSLILSAHAASLGSSLYLWLIFGYPSAPSSNCARARTHTHTQWHNRMRRNPPDPLCDRATMVPYPTHERSIIRLATRRAAPSLLRLLAKI